MAALNTEWLMELWKRGNRRLAIAGAFGFGGMMALLYWQGGRIIQRLEGTATNDSLVAQTAIMKETGEDVLDRLDERFDAYDDTLKSFLRAERKLAVDTTLKPMLKMLFSLSKQVEQLQSQQRSTQNQVRELPAVYEGSLRSIIEEKPPSRTDALLEELLRAQEEQRAFNMRMDSLVRAKRKNNKVGL